MSITFDIECPEEGASTTAIPLRLAAAAGMGRAVLNFVIVPPPIVLERSPDDLQSFLSELREIGGMAVVA